MKSGAIGIACLFSVMLSAGWDKSGTPVERYEVASPSGDLVATISTGDEMAYSVTFRGRTLVTSSPFSLSLGDGRVIGPGSSIMDVRRREVDDVIEPAVPEKFSRIRDHYSELSLDFASGWGLDVRAYDDGVAYRFRTSQPGPLTVVGEEFSAAFPENPAVWLHVEESFLTHSERVYRRMRLDSIPSDTFASLPALVAFDDGLKLAITEADLQDYP